MQNKRIQIISTSYRIFVSVPTDAVATEAFITEHVKFTKSYYDLVWTILEVTRTREDHLAIMDTFYMRVEKMIRANLERFEASASMAVVDIVKI